MIKLNKDDIVRLRTWYTVVYGEGFNGKDDDALNNKLRLMLDEVR